MYKKALIPLDGSREAEGVFSVVEREIAPDGEVILLHVIPMGRTQDLGVGRGSLAQQAQNERARAQYSMEGAYQRFVGGVEKPIPSTVTRPSGEGQMYGTQQEENDRSKAMVYLTEVVNRLKGDNRVWRPEVTVVNSVAKGIADFAVREQVDLIAMYTHDRRGIARLIQGSIASDVQRTSSIEVKVFKPFELTGAPVTLTIERKAVPGAEEEVNRLLRELRGRATQQPGYISGESKVDAYDPTVFIVVSNWSSLTAWDNWLNNPQRAKINDRIDALIQGKATIRLWISEPIRSSQLSPTDDDMVGSTPT